MTWDESLVFLKPQFPSLEDGDNNPSGYEESESDPNVAQEMGHEMVRGEMKQGPNMEGGLEP